MFQQGIRFQIVTFSRFDFHSVPVSRNWQITISHPCTSSTARQETIPLSKENLNKNIHHISNLTAQTTRLLPTSPKYVPLWRVNVRSYVVDAIRWVNAGAATRSSRPTCYVRIGFDPHDQVRVYLFFQVLRKMGVDVPMAPF